jgi:TonB family protein
MIRQKNNKLALVNIALAISSLFFTTISEAQVDAIDFVSANPPFYLTDDTLKANPKGIDVEVSIGAALKLKPPVKTEYETNLEFDDRLKKFSEKAFTAKNGLANRVAVIHPASAFPLLWRGGNPTIESEYDAETEIMSVKLDSWLGCLPLKRTIKSKRQYSATNGFGQKVNVVEADEFETCLGLDASGSTTLNDLSFSFRIAKRDAPSVRKVLGVVVIGQLAPPYATEEREHEQPTTKSPVELHRVKRSLNLKVDDVWIINITSGAVLTKHNSLFSNSEPAIGESFSSIGRCQSPTYRKSELPNFNLVVDLEFVIRSDGSIATSSIKKSSGIDSLDKRAIESISRCSFKPGTKNGVPIEGTTIVKFHFGESNAQNF